MMIPTLPGWKVETIGDDIAWMKFGKDGKLYAVNPEAGFFGVAPGTSRKTNPNALAMLEHDVVFTNCAKTDDGDIWWEGMGDPPAHAIDWRGNEWTPDRGVDRRASERPVHGADRAVSLGRPAVGRPRRRADRRDAVRRPPRHRGAARVRGARLGARRVPRLDDVLGDDRAPRPARSASSASTRWRCCRSAATTWPTTSPTGSRSAAASGAELPRIFYVNWFRRDDDGKFLWPGFGENSRVLAWVFRRLDGAAEANETAIGLVPPVGEGGIDTTGLDIEREAVEKLLEVDPDSWNEQLPQMQEHYAKFGDRLPAELRAQLEALETRLGRKRHSSKGRVL